MIVDLDPLDGSIEADVCVIGAGPAGISIALRLARERNLGVCLLESGGLVFEESNQELARAETEGAPYYPLEETRVRAFGGSSWSWGGVCTPLDSMAFADRPWLHLGGWPLRKAELDSYLDDAFRLCGVSDEDRRRVDAATSNGFEAAGLDRHAVVPVPVYFSRPIRFGIAYRDELGERANVRVQLHATVTGLVVDDGRVVEAQGVWERRRPFRVRAREFVLAMGGVENPRLLMTSGLGGPAVGRYFMEHPRVPNRYHIRPGATRLASLIGGGAATTLRFYRMSIADDRQPIEQLLTYHANLSVGYSCQRSRQWESIRRIAIALRSPWNESPYFQDAGGGRLRVRIGDVATALRRPDRALVSALGAVMEVPSLRRYLEIWSAIEQLPEAGNRIELLPERDALGMPRVRVHWRVGAVEEATYRRALSILVGQLERIEPGLSAAPLDEPDPWPGEIVGNWHHEGTTRMDADPAHGVVDGDCRVHGMANLFVAGSSVFPTSGSTSPTLTIVQLGLRLADHLTRRLRVRPEIAGRSPA